MRSTLSIAKRRARAREYRRDPAVRQRRNDLRRAARLSSALGTERTQKGAANNNARLAETQVLEIIALRAANAHLSLSQVALDYGVSRKTVKNILAGRNWKHLPRPAFPPRARRALTSDERRERNREWERANRAPSPRAPKNRAAAAKVVRALRARLRDALRGKLGSNGTRKLIGCTAQQLIAYLTPMLSFGWTWENRGNGTWHIDHIKPLVIAALDPSRLHEVCHYTNLRPLAARHNVEKADTYCGRRITADNVHEVPRMNAGTPVYGGYVAGAASARDS